MGTNVGTLSVNVAAEIKALTTGLKTSTREVAAFTTRVQGYMEANNQVIKRAAHYFKLLGVAAVSGIGMAVKTFGDLEQGYIRVAKTTGFTELEMKSLRKEIESLAISMTGISIKELQEISAIAGQLGIHGMQDILSFTRTIAQMGVATDLTAEEAATGMARLGVVLGEDITQFQRMGSVMNELSNNTTATASDILDLSLRLGGAGKVLGLTTAEIMGFAAALRDVGVDIERGGTSLSQVMMRMLTDTENFANVSGLSLEKYTEMIKKNPIQAIMALSKSLSSMDKLTRAAALEDLNLQGVRVAETLMKLSSASQKVTQDIGIANQEWAEGASLQREYETASKGLLSQLTTLKNVVIEVAGFVGEGLSPEIKNFIEYVRDNKDAIKEWAQSMGENLSHFAVWFVTEFVPQMRESWNALKVMVYGGAEAVAHYAKTMTFYAQGLAGWANLFPQVRRFFSNLRIELDAVIDVMGEYREQAWESGLATSKFTEYTSASARIAKESDKTTQSIKKTTQAIQEQNEELDEYIGKKKDIVSEFIGAFEWKPPAMAMAGGAGIAYRPSSVLPSSLGNGGITREGGMVNLHLSIQVDNKGQFLKRMDEAVTRLGVFRD